MIRFPTLRRKQAKEATRSVASYAQVDKKYVKIKFLPLQGGVASCFQSVSTADFGRAIAASSRLLTDGLVQALTLESGLRGEEGMDLTVREHTRRLQQRLETLNEEIMRRDLSQEQRNRLESDIRAVNLALAYYQSALEVEQRLRGMSSSTQ